MTYTIVIRDLQLICYYLMRTNCIYTTGICFVLARKRATLNQLLQKLIALYGNDEIHFSGRSAHVRFGAGGR